jgi:hypothetical protein
MWLACTYSWGIVQVAVILSSDIASMYVCLHYILTVLISVTKLDDIADGECSPYEKALLFHRWALRFVGGIQVYSSKVMKVHKLERTDNVQG